ncbi:EamA family transporter [Ligilactobacillus sp. LYQ60]|uniref:EamA family transporter n=1 Tax=unclassified Ligilactobacillus TaxID=2767920 RepID=UPI0038529767
MKGRKWPWVLLGIMSTTCWGISGVFAKILFAISPRISPMTVTQVRMIIGGITILFIGWLVGRQPLKIWYRWHDAGIIVSYGILGLIPVQLFYFMTVKIGNASIATILQFIGPFFIMLYMAVRHHEIPSRLEVISAVAAFIGVVIVATNGRFTQLAITPLVLIYGLISAVGVATNTLIPRSLLKTFSSMEITGWGLVIAGIGLEVVSPTRITFALTSQVLVMFLMIIVIGTVIPFIAFTTVLKYISPTVASMLDAFEPLTATVGSVLVLGLHLSLATVVGSLIIIIAVIGLNYQPNEG